MISYPGISRRSTPFWLNFRNFPQSTQILNSYRRFLHKCIDEIFDRNLEKVDLMQSSHRENLSEELDRSRKQFVSMNKVLRHNNKVLGDCRLFQTGETNKILKNLLDQYPKL